MLKLISKNLYKTNYEGLTGKQIDELRILKRDEIIAQRNKELEQKYQQHKQEIKQLKQKDLQLEQEIEQLKQQLKLKDQQLEQKDKEIKKLNKRWIKIINQPLFTALYDEFQNIIDLTIFLNYPHLTKIF